MPASAAPEVSSVLSSTAEYALKSVIYLAAHATEHPVRVGEVAGALGIPRNYLAKILHELGRGGVLVSSRGKHGGFQLAGDPRQLSLLDVVRQFDSIAEQRACLLGRGLCSDRNACAAHWRWKSVSEQIATFFRGTTVADLMASTPVPA